MGTVEKQEVWTCDGDMCFVIREKINKHMSTAKYAVSIFDGTQMFVDFSRLPKHMCPPHVKTSCSAQCPCATSASLVMPSASRQR